LGGSKKILINSRKNVEPGAEEPLQNGVEKPGFNRIHKHHRGSQMDILHSGPQENLQIDNVLCATIQQLRSHD